MPVPQLGEVFGCLGECLQLRRIYFKVCNFYSAIINTEDEV
jgi:hypothetical protein